jgi:hypothetical protein
VSRGRCYYPNFRRYFGRKYLKIGLIYVRRKKILQTRVLVTLP